MWAIAHKCLIVRAEQGRLTIAAYADWPMNVPMHWWHGVHGQAVGPTITAAHVGPQSWVLVNPGGQLALPGQAVAVRLSGPVTNEFVVRIALWQITAALMLLPLACLMFVSVRQRQAAVVSGRCPRCGYDIRATPDRCPECGTALKRPAGARNDTGAT